MKAHLAPFFLGFLIVAFIFQSCEKDPGNDIIYQKINKSYILSVKEMTKSFSMLTASFQVLFRLNSSPQDIKKSFWIQTGHLTFPLKSLTSINSTHLISLRPLIHSPRGSSLSM